MAKRKPSEGEITFESACGFLEEILRSDLRQEIVGDLLKSRTFSDALFRLRDGMHSHIFRAGADQLYLERIAKKFDTQTRNDGFHILNDWDGKADKLNKHIIPIDLLNYYLTAERAPHTERKALEVLLDYYFIYILALLASRVWAGGDANQNLDRVSNLLRDLQGPSGSSHKFAENAETLILIGTSHFEPDDKAYVRLLQKIRELDDAHRLNIAFIHSGILGSHLRFGFEFQYRRDIAAMRSDNGPDYPWLCFSLLTLIRNYSRMHDTPVDDPTREKIVEGILNALSPDTRAFLGKVPSPLAGHEADYAEFCDLFNRYKEGLFSDFERHRPSERSYSPISLDFNFPHNVVKGVVVHSLLTGQPSGLTLNDLLSGIPRDEELNRGRESMLRALMGYAESSPDTIRGRPVPIIIYKLSNGFRNFAKTISLLKGQKESSS